MAEVELRANFVDGASEGLEKLAEHVRHLTEAYLSFEGLKKIAETINEAQESTIKLDRAFQAFGDTLGVSRRDLEQFAEEAQKTTFFNSSDIKEAQAALAGFTSLTGNAFREARETALDLAAAMGTNVTTAATQLGRALESPSQGFRTLRELGIILSPVQRELIRNFEETGRTAQAQAFILDSIKFRTQGLAREMTDTLGGALKNLKNAFESAFEGQGANLKGLTDSIHDLANTIADDAFRSSIQDLVAAMVTVADYAAKSLGFIVRMVEKGGELAARLNIGKADTLQETLQSRLDLYQGLLNSATEHGPMAGERRDAFLERLQAYRESIAEIKGEMQHLNDGSLWQKFDDFQMDVLKAAANAKGRYIGGAPKLQGVLLNDVLTADHSVGDKVRQFYQDLLESVEPEVDKIERENDRLGVSLRELVTEFNQPKDKNGKPLSRGGISQGTANSIFSDIFEADLQKAAASVKRMQVPVSDAVKQLQSGFEDMFNRLDFRARSFGQLFVDVLKSIFAKDLAQELISMLTKVFRSAQSGGGGGGSGFWGGLIAGVGHLFGFASGGSFTVGGNGGTDSQLVAFKATPGERVTVNTPGQGSGGGFVYSPVTNIQAAPGTDMNQLRAIIALNNDKQRAEMLRMLERNGFGRLR